MLPYESIPILAILVHVIINKDVIWKTGVRPVPAQSAYRGFLFGILAYYVTDALWGILDGAHLVPVLFADTSVYFIAMTTAVLLWTRYVIAYLEEKNAFRTFLSVSGAAFFVFGVVVVIVNIFVPILFWFDAAEAYHAGAVRYVTLGLQVLMFLLTSIHTLMAMRHAEVQQRRRHRAIFFYGIAMIALIVIQVFFPLLPLYSIGFLLGSCVLHAFVVEDEEDEYRRELEETIERDRQHERELGSARRLAYTDPLTGVKSKHAYIEMESDLNNRILKGEPVSFAVVVFDLNDLKKVNDTHGHEAGDAYIKEACRIICSTFKHSPVYRLGGDEFVAILQGEDYENRSALISAFDILMEDSVRSGGVVVSAGMAERSPGQQGDYWSVLELADSRMYHRKKALKALAPA